MHRKCQNLLLPSSDRDERMAFQANVILLHLHCCWGPENAKNCTMSGNMKCPEGGQVGFYLTGESQTWIKAEQRQMDKWSNGQSRGNALGMVIKCIASRDWKMDKTGWRHRKHVLNNDQDEKCQAKTGNANLLTKRLITGITKTAKGSWHSAKWTNDRDSPKEWCEPKMATHSKCFEDVMQANQDKDVPDRKESCNLILSIVSFIRKGLAMWQCWHSTSWKCT